jgi:hypothetical protein
VRHFLNTIVRDASTNLYCERPVHPWVVFTAGAMGAGKSRAMHWLHARGLFPLPSFVQVTKKNLAELQTASRTRTQSYPFADIPASRCTPSQSLTML